MFKWLFGNNDPLHITDKVQKRINEIKRLNSEERIVELELSDLRAESKKYSDELNKKKSNSYADELLNAELLSFVKNLQDTIKKHQRAIRKKDEDEKQAKRLEEARKARLQREAKENERSLKKQAKKSDNFEIRNKRKKLLQDAIDQHYPTLRRNFNRLLRINDYGAIELDERREEFDKFLKSVGFIQHWGMLLLAKVIEQLHDYKNHQNYRRHSRILPISLRKNCSVSQSI